MQTITTIGLDIAKSAFQVHGVDAGGQVVIRRQLRRRHVLAFFQKLPPCLVGIERVPHRTIDPVSCRRWVMRWVDAAGLCEALRQAAEE
jgi:transposase